VNWLALAIAFFAVVIAAAQWWSGRQQLAINLFDKRFAVYMDVRKIASEALQLGKIESRGLVNEIFARGRFLFDPELVKELEHLYRLVGALEVGQKGAAMDITNHCDRITPLFNPYLKMDQQLPSFKSLLACLRFW
jgi:hypothetical protein